ncbi:hypothetical protein OIO90_001409, partial [Microbotryomycetes sp. JL221]
MDKEESATSSEQSSLRQHLNHEDLHKRRRILKTVLGLACATTLVAISLGVGLGVGLKQKNTVGEDVTGQGNQDMPSNPLTSSSVQPQNSSAFVLRGAKAMSSEPAQERIYNFIVEEKFGSPDGYNRSMLVVNGLFPGPTIEVNSDDRIIVNVTNLLSSNSTAIHWHGLYQRGTPWFDGTNGITQCGIPPGNSMIYNFTLNGWTGTTWWHAHYGAQYTDGLFGALI